MKVVNAGMSGGIQMARSKVDLMDLKPGSAFQKLVKEEVQANLKERVEEMLGVIDEKQQALLNMPSIKTLEAYKGEISTFLSQVTSFEAMGSEDFINHSGRHQTLKKIEKIEKELNELTGEVLSANRDGLKLVEITSGIKGLILDIVY